MCLLRLNEYTGYLFFPINTLEIEMGKVVPQRPQGWASQSHDSDSSRLLLMTRTRFGLKNFETLTRLYDSSHPLRKNFIYSYKKSVHKIKTSLINKFHSHLKSCIGTIFQDTSDE